LRWPVFYSLVVSAKYNRIGDGYDTTRRADSAIVQALADYLNFQKHGRYLDIGCGTGNYTCALAGQGGAWTGLDPSALMLEAARVKSDNIVWHLGAAENLPFEDAGFDGAICTLAVHHFTDISRGFAEIGRVLKPGARLVMFTVTPAQTQAYWLNRYFPKMLEADRKTLPTLAALEAAAKFGGLEVIGTFPYFISEATQDFFFYSGKFRPSLYLSEAVRQGMSCFRLLAHKDELAGGLAQLEADIASSAIAEHIANSQNEIGDYCFFIAEKPVGIKKG
jgi:ubiquinone/menaquinone biosynthesis C-methylase UbiE